MLTFLVIISLLGGAVGLLGVLFSPSLAILGVIGLACLAAILARIEQAGNQAEIIDGRLDAIFKLLANR